MRNPIKFGIAIGVVSCIAGAGWYFSSKSNSKLIVKPPVIETFAKEIKKSPKDFIAKNEASNDVKVQTAVTRARMTEGYVLAETKDFVAARAQFKEASYKHKGTEAMNPDYGTLSEQAAYQAIVCLDAGGKKQEAKKEYRKFMEEHKLSPLIHACFRRLERLNKEALPEDQARLEAGIAEQEKRIRFETSVCGPKCLEKILPLLGSVVKNYKELAKLCGTTEKGTTMEGLKKGCETLGMSAIGLELNNRDFSKMTKPFIWLQSDHYLAILEIKDGKAHFYDPRFNYDDWRDLPKEDDPKFRAQVLAFEVPTSELVSDQKPSTKS